MVHLRATVFHRSRRLEATCVAISVTYLCVLTTAVSADVTVLNFDDLTAPYQLTGTSYAGLTWEQGNPGDLGFLGEWVIPASSRSNYPHSGRNNIVNGWGSTLMGIGFPSPVDMSGSYIATQGASAGWPQQVRVHGYLAGSEVDTTDWFTQISTTPVWFDMSVLTNVDRIVFEAPAMGLMLSYYGLDDLTFTPIPEPAGLAALGFFAAGLLSRRRAGEGNRVDREVIT